MSVNYTLSTTTKLVILVAFILFSAYNLLLSALQDYILFVSNDPSVLGTSFGVFTISALFSRFLSGWLIEKIDDAIALVFANIILTIALGFYSVVDTVSLILITRAIQGFGWALATVTILTMISENTRSENISKAFGYLNGLGSFSLLIFPVFGSWIVTIKTLETFQTCFIISSGISGLSSITSLYVWRTIPPTLAHEETISSFPDIVVITTSFSALLLFIPLGLFLSYSPEIAEMSNIQNPGIFFSFYALAQILGSAIGGIWVRPSRYRLIAMTGSILAIVGIGLLLIFNSILGYISSAFVVGFGIAIANLALNSHVSSISTASEARGMALYSSGVDAAIAIGSFSTAILLGLGFPLTSILLVLAFASIFSAINTRLFIEWDD